MLSASEILSLIPKGVIPDGLTISGGEPFEQENGIFELINLFSERFSDDILEPVHIKIASKIIASMMTARKMTSSLS